MPTEKKGCRTIYIPKSNELINDKNLAIQIITTHDNNIIKYLSDDEEVVRCMLDKCYIYSPRYNKDSQLYIYYLTYQRD